MPESNADKLSRVQLMAQGDSGTWDHSPNDIEALRYVLESREELLEVLKEFDTDAILRKHHGQNVDPLMMSKSSAAIKRAEAK